MRRLHEGPPLTAICCGSRSVEERHEPIVLRVLCDLLPPGSTVREGEAPGADRLCRDVAEKMGFEIQKRPADWNKYPKVAGFLRNKEMAKEGADLCIAFWDGKSNGTKDMMEQAVRHGIPVWIEPVVE